ncbi:MAG: protein kinase [Chloroflexota bacterium]|nr:protein kinase [Chloroflexota bacterium]
MSMDKEPDSGTPANTEPVPQVSLEGYKYLDSLGSGGYGTVYLMQNEGIGVKRAVKVLSGEIDRETIERFRREAHAGAMLDHRNLVTVHDAKVGSDSRIYLIMDYVAGPTLARYSPSDLSTALEIASQLAVALAYLHSNGLTHRDLKPENIFITTEKNPIAAPGSPNETQMRIRVGDFGLIKVNKAVAHEHGNETLTEAGYFIGTRPYASPEQLQDTASVNEQTDLYSLGVILYQLLTNGSLPPGYKEAEALREQDRIGALHMLKQAKLKLPPKPSAINSVWQIPEQLDDVVLKLLQPRPEDRYQTAVEVYSALEAVRSRITPPGPLPPGMHLRFQDVSSARTPDGVRSLFNALGYQTVREQFDVSLAGFPEAIADNIVAGYTLARYTAASTLQRFEMMLFELRDISTAHLRRLAENMLRRGGDYLLVVAQPTRNAAGTDIYEQLMLVYPSRVTSNSSGSALFALSSRLTFKIHTLTLSTVRPTRYMLNVLERIAVPEGLDPVQPQGLTTRLVEGFNVEAVSDNFYKQYATLYRKLVQDVRASNPAVSALGHVRELEGFVQRMLGRIMFLYFVQKKGWLSNDPEFLTTQFDLAQEQDASYYADVLVPLFFDTLALAGSDRLASPLRAKPWSEEEIPYLNGGLFELGKGQDYERRLSLDNSLFDHRADGGILKFFNSYDFTVEEDTPLNVQVAVDPEMLGKVFEELVTDRHETGSYYTPKPVVSFMCREALKSYLVSELPGEPAEVITSLVDERDASQVDKVAALAALHRISVAEPACGSGAYLLGMMHELLDLRLLLLSGDKTDAGSTYSNKLSIIRNNLYGVDIDPFAVNIARLRLWLSLIVDYNGVKPPPLPNLDFKIEEGDSLTAPNPQTVPQSSFRDAEIQQYRDAKRRFIDIHGSTKDELRQEIDEIKRNIALWTHNGQTVLGFDWAVEFVEVFAEGGFDIILANPPYVRADAQFMHLRGDETARQAAIAAWKVWRAALAKSKIYETLYEKWDLYIPFLERAYQLLRPGGQMVYIIPDAYNIAKYARKSQEFFVRNALVRRIDFCTDIPLFKASVRNTIVHFTKLVPSTSDVPLRVRRWGQRAEEFSSNAQVLPSSPQGIAGIALFRPNNAGNFAVDSGSTGKQSSAGFVTLQALCYISKGMVIHADERKAHGQFKAEDLVSDTRDSAHPKPYVEGKDILRWGVSRIRYLEYGTQRAPKLFSRPTFAELHDTKERLIASRMTQGVPLVTYDDQQLYSNHTAIIFVPWHALRGVQNKSIKKTAKYEREVGRAEAPPDVYREELETLSQAYDIKYILAVMNSDSARHRLALNPRGKLDIYPDDWKELPVPVATAHEQARIVRLVDEIHYLLRDQRSLLRSLAELPDEDVEELRRLEARLNYLIAKLYARTEIDVSSEKANPSAEHGDPDLGND